MDAGQALTATQAPTTVRADNRSETCKGPGRRRPGPTGYAGQLWEESWLASWPNLRLPKHEPPAPVRPVAAHVHPYAVARREAALEQRQRQRVLDPALDDALERAGAVRRKALWAVIPLAVLGIIAIAMDAAAAVAAFVVLIGLAGGAASTP